jgi:hypothetical protein
MPRFEFESGTFQWFYAITFLFGSCGELHLLVSWCVGDRCDMVGSDEGLGKSRRPGAEDRGWSSIGRILGGRTIGRSSDATCGLHHAHGDEERGFLS